jgi:hypothetical protein
LGYGGKRRLGGAEEFGGRFAEGERDLLVVGEVNRHSPTQQRDHAT